MKNVGTVMSVQIKVADVKFERRRHDIFGWSSTEVAFSIGSPSLLRWGGLILGSERRKSLGSRKVLLRPIRPLRRAAAAVVHFRDLVLLQALGLS